MRYGPCLGTVLCTYSASLSKNARLAKSFRGKIYIKPEAKSAERVLLRELQKGLKGVMLYENKVWIDVKVYKTRTNTDAVNFIDAICDVLKVVIKVDDRYFCIKSWDYEIDRENPRMILKIYQPERRDA